MSDAATGSATCEPRWRPSDWVHLVYLVIPFFQPIFDPTANLWDWLLPIGIVLVFVPLYALGQRRPERFRVWCAATVGLGICTVPLNGGAAVLFVYAAAFAAAAETRRRTLYWLLGLTALCVVLFVLSPLPIQGKIGGVIPSTIFIWIIGLIQIDNAAREREAAALRVDRARSEHLATLAERERIARDLHDLLGHSLTAVIVRAQLIRELVAADPAQAGTMAAEVEDTARKALSEVRRAVTGWRQATLDEELDSAKAALASVGVELTVRRAVSVQGLTLVSATEHALALALREAVTNVARHAQARRCHVGIDTREGELRLVVADDGVGGNRRDGNGLTGMRERITAIGGHVERTGSPGTTLTVSVPLEVAT